MLGFGGDLNPKVSLVVQKTHFKPVRIGPLKKTTNCDPLENNISGGWNGMGLKVLKSFCDSIP